MLRFNSLPLCFLILCLSSIMPSLLVGASEIDCRGKIDVWYQNDFPTPNCTLQAGPVYFTPGECFPLPFLASFLNGYFSETTIPEQGGYAVVYFSVDNTTAYIYAYEDAACSTGEQWGFSGPIATSNCGENNFPNIWAPTNSACAYTSAPSWPPSTMLMAPVDVQFPNGTCLPVQANALPLGQCFGAGTALPTAVFCSEVGQQVTFATYSPGSNCEDAHVVTTLQRPSGCDMSGEPMGYVCPTELGPAPPALQSNSMIQTWYNSVDTCSETVVYSAGYAQDVCITHLNLMFHCNLANNSYTQYQFSGPNCAQEEGFQVYPVGCDGGTTTFTQCNGPDMKSVASKGLFDEAELIAKN